MIKQEIIEKICKYFKLTNFEAEKIYDDIFASIIQGVKEDNIADVNNLGEFIIKYNSSDINNKKTVEFLPTLSLEEEINQRSFDQNRQFEPAKYVNPEEVNKTSEHKSALPPVIGQFEKIQNTAAVEINKTAPLEIVNYPESEISTEVKHSVEEEIRRKREEILSKITKPKEEYIHKPIVTESIVMPPVIIPPAAIPFENPITDVKEEIIEVKEKSVELLEEDNAKVEEINAKTETITSNITENITDSLTGNIETNVTETKQEVEEILEKSFSDYFTEVAKEDHVLASQINKTTFPPPFPPVIERTVIAPPPIETVIPPSAVELHNQITGDQNKTNEYQTTINPLPFANGNSNGNGDNSVHKLQDNSYYIWYKDSEPNSSDTQTMSYEYELLYQATKEAEYKSKLRVYVTTFIMFFSVVLILLIFSPVIYKYFFTPKEDQSTEEVQPETSTNEQPTDPQNNTNQASVNTLDNQQPINNTQPDNTNEQPKQEQPVQEQPKQEQPKQEQPKQEQPKQEQPKQEQPKQEQPKQNTDISVPGVTKSSMGWMDDYNKVIYIQLDNGKFTIQESAWDSDAKANKRLSSVGSFIPGLKGTIMKVDLGSKGTWYRTRFGEFTTIEEAKKTAEQLRTKEKRRLQALILTFLLYT